VAAAAGGGTFSGLTQVLQWPLSVRVAIGILAPFLAMVGPEMRVRAAQDDTRDRLLTGRVAVTGGGGRLPRVREVGDERLRVHAARVHVPYIERDRQPDVDAALGPGRAVLVVGHSMAGKTRLVVASVQARFGEAPLLVPESGRALREMIEAGLSPTRTVVLLDDLERFLGEDALTVGLLERIIAVDAIVVATIRTDVLERYRPRDQLRPLEWGLLQRFTQVDLSRRLSGSEHDRVRAQITDPGVLAGVEHYGLAEYLGAGPDAVAKFEHGEIVNPVGHALVRVAADWRRAGFTRPIPRTVLTAALPAYLDADEDVLRDSEALDQGLAWAIEKINETVALLHRRGGGGTGSDDAFEASEYLVDDLTAKSCPVPDEMWLLAVKVASRAEALHVGYATHELGREALEEAAWRRGAEIGDAEAMGNLAVLLEERGAIAEAESWYRLSAEAGCPAAMDNLGWLLDRRGETVEAETWHRQAAEARGPRRRAEQDRPRGWHGRATRPPGGPADAGEYLRRDRVPRTGT
jgi:TPR repeat protein